MVTALLALGSGSSFRVSGQSPSTVTTTVFTTIINTVTSTTWFTSTSTVFGVFTTVLLTTISSTTTVAAAPQTDVAGGAVSATGAWANSAYCSSFVATRSGSVNTLGVNVKSGVGNVRIGLFDASFNLIGQTGSTPISSATTWVDAPASGSIVGGRTYWLCLQSDSSSAVIYYQYLAGSGTYKPMAFAAYPTTLSPSADPWVANLRVTYS